MCADKISPRLFARAVADYYRYKAQLRQGLGWYLARALLPPGRVDAYLVEAPDEVAYQYFLNTYVEG